MNKKLTITIASAILGIAALLFVYFQFLQPAGVKISSKQEVTARFTNKDDFLLVIGGSLCSSCTEYKDGTITEYVKKYGSQNVIYIYADKISFANSTEFDTFKRDYNITYENSPTTYYVKDGVVVTMSEEMFTLAELEEFIENSN